MATPATTTGATPSQGGAAFPPFESESFASQLIWFALAFGLLYYLMSRIALPRIGAILEDRKARLASDLEEAHRLKAESEATAAEHQKALDDAHNRAQAMAQERRNALKAESDARRKVIEADLAEKLAQSEATIRSRMSDAMSHVRGIAAETAAAIVERLSGRAPDPAAIEAALDRPAPR